MGTTDPDLILARVWGETMCTPSDHLGQRGAAGQERAGARVARGHLVRTQPERGDRVAGGAAAGKCDRAAKWLTVHSELNDSVRDDPGGHRCGEPDRAADGG